MRGVLHPAHQAGQGGHAHLTAGTMLVSIFLFMRTTEYIFLLEMKQG
jgi:hypothetical protein